MPSFHLLNFGCRASQADGAAIKGQLLDSGFAEAESTSTSTCDIAILNTCTVTAAADAEVRQVLRRIHRENPGCRIMVTGCYAQRAPDEIAALKGVAWVIGNSHKHIVAEVLAAEHGCVASGSVKTPAVAREVARTTSPFPILTGSPGGQRTSDTRANASVLVGEISDSFHFVPAFADDRTRPTLKVQDGCDARCSFCIIPDVRGRSRSLPPEIVVNEVRRLENTGYKEIVLSGINLGGYGRDLGRSTSFFGLLETILAQTGISRLRISSIEPMDVTPALIRLVAREPRLAKHFHVPLQSGSDRILRLMNRRYWTTHYRERLLAIREQIPDCGIGADVMVGFPGETDDDHAVSLQFIDSLPFTYVHIFPYSSRPNTPAAEMPNQVNGRISRERGQEIRSVVERKRVLFVGAQVGRTLSVLTLDGNSESQCAPGSGLLTAALSSNYLKVILPGIVVPPNAFMDVQISRVHSGLLFGYPSGDGRPSIDDGTPGLPIRPVGAQTHYFAAEKQSS